MATKYVDATLGTDDASHGGATGAGAWKTLGYALLSKRVSAGDTILMSGEVHSSFPAGSTYIMADVDGVGTLTIDGVNAATINVPATAAQSVYQTENPNVELIFKDISFTNTGSINKRMFWAALSAKIYLDNVSITHGNFDFSATGNNGLISISGQINSCKRLIYNIGASGSATAAVKNSTIQSVESLVLSTAATIILDITGNTILSGTISRLLEITSGSVTGNVKFNKVLCGGALTSPFYMFSPILAAVLAGTLNITSNIFWWTGFDSLGYATQCVVLHNIFSFPTDANRCDFVPGKNYFAELDSSLANKVVSGESVALDSYSSVIMCAGDSIVYNYGWENPFESITGIEPINIGLSGAKIEGVYFNIDRFIWANKPRYLLLQCGMNDFMSSTKSADFITSAVYSVQNTLEKIIGFGITPIWCCMTPKGVSDTDVQSFNAKTQEMCASLGVAYIDISSAFRCNSSWNTLYYDDLSTNIHPNLTGREAQGLAWAHAYFMAVSGVTPETNWAPFDATMPALSLAPTAPGDLRSVQTWSKVATAQEIENMR